MKTKKLVIIGAGETAAMLYEYFTCDSGYEVVAFSVHGAYITGQSFCGLPVCAFETLEQHFPPDGHEVFVAVSYVKLNRVRAKLYNAVKEKGYKCANYVSSRAIVWRTAVMGDNCCVLENSIVSHNTKLGNDVSVRPGALVGHGVVVNDHVWVGAHCMLGGYSKIGAYSFLGINSTVNDLVVVGDDTIVGSAALLTKDCGTGQVLAGVPAKALAKSSYETFEVAVLEI